MKHDGFVQSRFHFIIYSSYRRFCVHRIWQLRETNQHTKGKIRTHKELTLFLWLASSFISSYSFFIFLSFLFCLPPFRFLCLYFLLLGSSHIWCYARTQ
jgi:hypothetical protein